MASHAGTNTAFKHSLQTYEKRGQKRKEDLETGKQRRRKGSQLKDPAVLRVNEAKATLKGIPGDGGSGGGEEGWELGRRGKIQGISPGMNQRRIGGFLDDGRGRGVFLGLWIGKKRKAVRRKR